MIDCFRDRKGHLGGGVNEDGEDFSAFININMWAELEYKSATPILNHSISINFK